MTDQLIFSSSYSLHLAKKQAKARQVKHGII